jgi:hypothetical protein
MRGAIALIALAATLVGLAYLAAHHVWVALAVMLVILGYWIWMELNK